ncbi:hypothetical protein AQF52_2804 [Streptomyces venezuelae]|nr:hypothetical protein AQF52_2804 [Streptomyces venezuelae]CUM41249.1 hypothetical protein BN2537_11463 [Streptomyces venezuelae]
MARFFVCPYVLCVCPDALCVCPYVCLRVPVRLLRPPTRGTPVRPARALRYPGAMRAVRLLLTEPR